MRLLSYMVTRNEADRYLAECLEELLPYVDGLLLYDDQSDEPIVVSDPKVMLVNRPPEAFSFVDDEGMFREDAWRQMEQQFDPEPGDWVLTLDADEFLRAPYPEYVKEVCEAADRASYDGIDMHVHEVWTPIVESPEIRTDGFWGQITALRLCKWQQGGRFKDAKMGGGSLPTYVTTPKWVDDIDILHYGYATQKDRQRKYDRYSVRRGHNPKHISSILDSPTLAPLPPLGYSR